jgi:hypothetical protein
MQHGNVESQLAPRVVHAVHSPPRQTIWPQHSASLAQLSDEALQHVPALHSPEQHSPSVEHAWRGSRQVRSRQAPWKHTVPSQQGCVLHSSPRCPHVQVPPLQANPLQHLRFASHVSPSLSHIQMCVWFNGPQ